MKTYTIITNTVLSAFMLAVLACGGGSQSLPDVEATVEARVELARASLVAPAGAPLPTYTPKPTPTPTKSFDNWNWQKVLDAGNAPYWRTDLLGSEVTLVGVVTDFHDSSSDPYCLATSGEYISTNGEQGSPEAIVMFDTADSLESLSYVRLTGILEGFEDWADMPWT